MIPRYEKKEISEIWTDEYKFKTFLKAELAIMEALEGNKVPVGSAKKIAGLVKINPDRVNEIEKVTKHDVIAFCTSITEQLEPSLGKYFHFGVTSSDIIDTALTLQIKDSLALIIKSSDKLLSALYARAKSTKHILCMGRSHGMYAEPMSFGGKLLGHFCEFQRRHKELVHFFENDLTVQFSGAVGNYTILSPALEEKAAKILGIKTEPVSTQVIPRDRIAKLLSIHALYAAAIERFCVEIRHLHHSDLNCLHEGFSKGQKGSSIMPHKKNPIAAENLTGMARLIKSHQQVALENIVLWHERDISHSSAERLMLPDNFGLMLYTLDRLTETIERLEFHEEVIEGQVKNTYSYLSSFYLHELIEKTNLTREEHYALVQAAAFKAEEAKNPELFFTSLNEQLKTKNLNIELTKLSFDDIKKLYLKYSDAIFSRVTL
jgi:adenylosuccinate lyase